MDLGKLEKELVAIAARAGAWLETELDQEYDSLRAHFSNVVTAAEGALGHLVHLLHFTGTDRSAVDDNKGESKSE